MPGSVEGLHRERTSTISVGLADPRDLDLAQPRRTLFEAGTAGLTQAASQTASQAASAAVKTARKLGITPYLEIREHVRARQRG